MIWFAYAVLVVWFAFFAYYCVLMDRIDRDVRNFIEKYERRD